MTLPPGWTATPRRGGGWMVTGPRGEEATLTPAGKMEYGSDWDIGWQDTSTEVDLVAWVRQTESRYRSG